MIIDDNIAIVRSAAPRLIAKPLRINCRFSIRLAISWGDADSVHKQQPDLPIRLILATVPKQMADAIQEERARRPPMACSIGRMRMDMWSQSSMFRTGLVLRPCVNSSIQVWSTRHCSSDRISFPSKRDSPRSSAASPITPALCVRPRRYRPHCHQTASRACSSTPWPASLLATGAIVHAVEPSDLTWPLPPVPVEQAPSRGGRWRRRRLLSVFFKA